MPVFDILALLASNIALAIVCAAALRATGYFQIALMYAAILSFGGAISLAGSMLPNSDLPYLMGSDGEGYFLQARQIAEHGFTDARALFSSNYYGYQLYLALWFTVFGSSLWVGLVANNALLLITLACLYQATHLLSASRQAARYATLAFVLTPQYLYYSFTLLKEPGLLCAFSLLLLAITRAARVKNVGFFEFAIFAGAIVIILIMRASILPFVALVLVWVAAPILRQRSHIFLVFIGALVLLAPLASEFSTYTFDRAFFSRTIFSNDVVSNVLSSGDVGVEGVVGRVSSVFLELPFLMKALLFPIPVVLQFFLPFNFWGSAFLDDHPVAFFSQNLNPLWYLFVGVWFLFAVSNYKKLDDVLMRRFLLAAVVFYIGTAIVYGGAIPRYAAPALVFVYPAVGYWWSRCQTDAATLASVRAFFQRYYFILLVGLIGYLSFQLMQ